MLRQVYGNTVSIFVRAEVPFECVDLLGVVFFSRRRLFVCYIRPSKMQEKKKKNHSYNESIGKSTTILDFFSVSRSLSYSLYGMSYLSTL